MYPEDREDGTCQSRPVIITLGPYVSPPEEFTATFPLVITRCPRRFLHENPTVPVCFAAFRFRVLGRLTTNHRLGRLS